MYPYLRQLWARGRRDGGGPLLAPYYALHDLIEMIAVARAAARTRTLMLYPGAPNPPAQGNGNPRRPSRNLQRFREGRPRTSDPATVNRRGAAIVPGCPRTDTLTRSPPPRLGQHRREVLGVAVADQGARAIIEAPAHLLKTPAEVGSASERTSPKRPAASNAERRTSRFVVTPAGRGPSSRWCDA